MTLGAQNKQFHGKVTVKNEAVAMQAPKRASIINCIQKDGTNRQTEGQVPPCFCFLLAFSFPSMTLYKVISRMKIPCHSFPFLQALVKIVHVQQAPLWQQIQIQGFFPQLYYFFKKNYFRQVYCYPKQTNKQAKI